jgi:hypothetical protein
MVGAARLGSSAVVFSCGEIVDGLQRNIEIGSRDGPWRAYGGARLRRLGNAALCHAVGTHVRQLCAQGESASACAVRELASGEHALGYAIGRRSCRLRATYAAPRQKTEHVLDIATHPLDPAFMVFLEWCSRVVAHLEEGWPLPQGATWELGTEPRGVRGPLKGGSTGRVTG